MVSKRILTAAVCIPVVAGIIGLCGEAAFFMLALAVFSFGLWEFFAITIPGASRATYVAGLVLGALILAGAYHDAGMAGPVRWHLLPGACALSFAALFWYHMSRRSVPLRDASVIAMAQLCGLVYVPFLGSFLLLLRGGANGIELIFLLLLVAWAGDTAAFAVGTWMGRRRFSTRISPKKTVEGAFASLAAGMLIAVCFKLLFLKNIALAHCVAMGLGLNIMNQFGDLCESFIKRACNVKDSGVFFPGHGGVLDRIDSLLLAAPFLYYYSTTVVTP